MTNEEKAVITAAFSDGFLTATGTEPSELQTAALRWAFEVVESQEPEGASYKSTRAEVISFLRLFVTDLNGAVENMAAGTNMALGA